ncbi:Rieske (2Fe-2S) protein [Tundrisphaera lichenicola]|uniref:Rieske (2Fe-2S) protein n=1 Tax=Tundrisphaera lichenicola TaxID=2029860 RepID=UPI003EB7FF43
MRWIEAASLDDLPPGSALEFIHEGRAFALFRSGDEITCLGGLCPHQGGRLALGTVEGSRVTCPRRGCLRWSFDLRSGGCSVGEGVRSRVYPVRVEGRTVLVALTDP